MSGSTTPLPEEDQTAVWQQSRHQLYLIGAAVVGILVVSNVISFATSEYIIDLVNRILTLVGLILPLITQIIARRNSNPKEVAVVPVPVAEVKEIVTADETVVAGPASELKTGTVLDEAA